MLLLNLKKILQALLLMSCLRECDITFPCLSRGIPISHCTAVGFIFIRFSFLTGSLYFRFCSRYLSQHCSILLKPFELVGNGFSLRLQSLLFLICLLDLILKLLYFFFRRNLDFQVTGLKLIKFFIFGISNLIDGHSNLRIDADSSNLFQD